MLASYQAEGRGCSGTVRETLTDLGVSDVVHDPRTAGETRRERTRDRLLSLGDEDRIPFLLAHHRDVTMDESDDIVEHVADRYR